MAHCWVAVAVAVVGSAVDFAAVDFAAVDDCWSSCPGCLTKQINQVKSMTYLSGHIANSREECWMSCTFLEPMLRNKGAKQGKQTNL